MKTLFKSLLVAAFAVIATVASTESYAQHQKNSMSPAEYAKATAKKMDNMVDLSDKQQKKVENIVKDYAKVLVSIRENKKLSNDMRRDNMRDAGAQLNKSLKKVLTADQFKKYTDASAKGCGCKSKKGGCCGDKATKGSSCCKDKSTSEGCCKDKAAKGSSCCK